MAILNPGDVVFFKKCTKLPTKRAQEIGFKGGHAFGVMLGVVAPFAPPPTEKILMPLMGHAGYISFDDVGNFLGEEQAKLCIKKFEDKYYPKIIVPPPKPALILPPSEVEQ